MGEEFSISTKGHEIVDITSKVEGIIAKAEVKEGMCFVYTRHSTCAMMINENYDPNILLDIMECLDKLIPQGKWRHDKVDQNAAAHIKASIIGPSETIPIRNKKLVLGQWQSIMLADFDGPRQRKVVVEVIGK